MLLFKNLLRYGNDRAFLNNSVNRTRAEIEVMLPLLFYCFLESRTEQEVALSAAAISALMFFHS